MIQNLQLRIAIVAVVLAVGVFLVYPSIGPVPNWWSKYLPANPIRLGLDLQGGLHLVLEVQADEAVEAAVDQTVSEAGSLMKEEKIRYKDIKRTSPTALTVTMRDPDQVGLFDTAVMGKLTNFKKTRSDTTADGFEIVLELDPKAVAEIKDKAVKQAVDTIRNRVDQFGVAEPDVVIHGTDRVIVQLPGLKEDIDRAVNIIKKTARLEFKLVDESKTAESAQKNGIPPGSEILYKADRNARTGVTSRIPYLIKKQVLLTGDVVTDSRPRPDRGSMIVSMEFNKIGARRFEQITGEHVNERLAIILDGNVYSAPTIKDRISGGSAIIEGIGNPNEAHDLALVLRAGSLPASVKILENRSVGPSLGEDSIRLGRNAIGLGMGLIVICMVVYYKWSGVVANAGLTLNLLLIFAVMVSPALRATLTLPGLAGIALVIGMAIDANILIFERIREELRAGKSPKSALDTGYARAFRTIFDSNATTVLAAIPLIQFGTGPVKGFAVTLLIGIIVSLFTSFFATRVVFDYAFSKMKVKQFSI